MRFLMKLCLALIFGFSMVACSDLDDTNADTGVDALNFGAGGNNDCFELVFPLSFTLGEGETQIADAREDIKTAIAEYKANNPGERVRPEFSFPLEVVDSDGETIEVISADMLHEIKKDCKGERGGKGCKGNCFDIVYPVSYALADGTTITGESKEEIRSQLKAWKEANPDAEERPVLVFPIEVINADGEAIAVADQESLKLLKEECKGERNKCFELVYPVSFLLPDGTTVSGESRQEIKTQLREWKANNPDAEEKPELVFPIQITTEEGETIDVDSKDELDILREEC